MSNDFWVLNDGVRDGWQTSGLTEATYPHCSLDGEEWIPLWDISGAKHNVNPMLVGFNTGVGECSGGWSGSGLATPRAVHTAVVQTLAGTGHLAAESICLDRVPLVGIIAA